MTNAPLVSVCIPTFNYGKFLRDSVTSAAAQTWNDLEIIVSDNCSTDETPQVMAELVRGDSRIRYDRNDRNIGIQGNFNRCLNLASGRYIKFLCADDLLAPICVARMVEVFETDRTVALVACGREIVDGELRNIGYSAYSTQSSVESGHEVIRRCFFRGNLIGEPTAVMFRKSDASHGFSDIYSQIFDLEMWFRLLEQGAFAFIPEPLCKFRRHHAQGTHGNLGSTRITVDRRRLFREFSSKSYLEAGLLEMLLWDIRMAWLLSRDSGTGEGLALPDVSDAVFFPKLLGPLFWSARSIGMLGTALKHR